MISLPLIDDLQTLMVFTDPYLKAKPTENSHYNRVATTMTSHSKELGNCTFSMGLPAAVLLGYHSNYGHIL